MPAPLPAAIRLVQSRIQAERDYLAGHETRTRQFLIDPILTALGWDVLDPTVVVLEAPAQRGWADYALLGLHRPSLVVEAKRLGTPLGRSVLTQSMRYGRWIGSQYVAITDGDAWLLFDTAFDPARANAPTLAVRLSNYEEPATALMLAQMERSVLVVDA